MRTRTRTTRTARGGRRAGRTAGIRAAAAGAVIATGLLASACGPAATGAGTPAPPTTTVSAAPLADSPGSATSTPAATASDAPTATPPTPTRTATHRPAPVTTTHPPAPTVHHTASSGSGSGSGSGGSGGTHRTEAPVAPGGGATAKCNDGTYSYSQHHQGTCSHHGGVAVFYK